MSNKTVFLILAIFMLVGGAIFLLPSDEKKIKENLASLADYCSTTNSDSVIENLRKVTLASKLCTVPCKIVIQSRNFNDEFNQKEISHNILMLKKKLPNTTFAFQDINISIPTDDNANMATTVQFKGESADGRFTDAYEVDITAIKIDGDWFFSSFTVVDFMKK